MAEGSSLCVLASVRSMRSRVAGHPASWRRTRRDHVEAARQPPLLPAPDPPHPPIGHDVVCGHPAHTVATVSQQTWSVAQLNALEHSMSDPAHASPASTQEPAPSVPLLDDDPPEPTESAGPQVARTIGTLPTSAVLTFTQA